MPTKEKKQKCLIPDLEIIPKLDHILTEEDVKVSLLELKRRVGAPKITFRKKRWVN